jgi:hypothetical protein
MGVNLSIPTETHPHPNPPLEREGISFFDLGSTMRWLPDSATLHPGYIYLLAAAFSSSNSVSISFITICGIRNDDE